MLGVVLNVLLTIGTSVVLYFGTVYYYWRRLSQEKRATPGSYRRLARRSGWPFLVPLTLAAVAADFTHWGEILFEAMLVVLFSTYLILSFRPKRS